MATIEHGQSDFEKTKQVEADPEMLGEKLWAMADSLRVTMDAAEYRHAVLGLIFLKHVSDTFEEYQSKLDLVQDADPEDPDEYRAQNILWVPPEGRWANIMTQTRQPAIGQIVDDAMAAIERENPAIKNVLPENYTRPALDKARLGKIIDLISNMRVADDEGRSTDVLGRVYEYFLSRFANTEGRKVGEFYTPRSVARLLVEMLQPYRGRVYDPCCGSSGMLVRSVEFTEAHANGNNVKTKTTPDISIYGQESNHAVWQLAKMNLVMRGMDSSRIVHADSFHNDLHPDLEADFILANPPFNVSNWGGERLQDDKRWVHGIPPMGNANFAWVQHIVHHLAPFGTAGFVLANGSMSSNRSGEGEIRKNLVEANLVDCIVALPGQLFYSTQIPACLWILSRNRGRAGRKDRVLFIDARQMGDMIDRTHCEIANNDIRRISGAYRAWCGDKQAGKYSNVSGFCKNATLDEIRKHEYVLAPGHYVGVESQSDEEPFEKKMKRLTLQWDQLQAESKKLDATIAKNIKNLGLNAKV